MELFLLNNYPFAWHKSKNVWIKGFFFDKDGQCYRNDELLEYFDGIIDEKDFYNRLNRINGHFAVVVKSGESCYVAVDRLRSLPMYICKDNDRIGVSDFATTLRDKFGLTVLDEIGIEEIKQSGYTVGNRTAYQAISQLCVLYQPELFVKVFWRSEIPPVPIILATGGHDGFSF